MHFRETKTVLWPRVVHRLRLFMLGVIGGVVGSFFNLLHLLKASRFMLLCEAFWEFHYYQFQQSIQK